MFRQQVLRQESEEPVLAGQGQRQGKLASQSQPRHPLLRLQQTIGNRAVGRLLQAKLTINQPGDEYEREADRVAEQVMRMPEPAIQRKACDCDVSERPGGDKPESGGECEDCKQNQLVIQRKATISDEALTVPPIVHEVLHSSGHPIDSVTRTFMESRFGQDFSSVRVHTDAKAAESAWSANAKAYTVGQDVVFADGRYSSHTTEGRRLLAHELTHVVQQSNIRPTTLQRKDIPDYEGYVVEIKTLSSNPPGWKEVHACKGVSPPEGGKAFTEYCPVVLEINTPVTVRETFAGGVWLHVKHPPVASLGGQRFGFVPAIYIKRAPTPTVKPPISEEEKEITLEEELRHVSPGAPARPKTRSSAAEAEAVDLRLLGTPSKLASVTGGLAGDIIKSVDPVLWPIYNNAFKGAIAEANALAFRPVIDKFNKILTSTPAMIQFIFGFIKGVPKGIISPITDLINLFNGAAELILKLFDWFETKAAGFVTEAVTELKALRAAWDKAQPDLKDLLRRAREEPLTLLGALANAVARASSSAINAARQIGAQILGSILSRIAAMSYGDFGEVFGHLLGQFLPDIILSSTGIGIAGALVKRVASFVRMVTEAVVTSLRAVREFLTILRSTWEVVASFFKSFLRGFAALGKKIWGALEGPLENFAEFLARALRGAERPRTPGVTGTKPLSALNEAELIKLKATLRTSETHGLSLVRVEGRLRVRICSDRCGELGKKLELAIKLARDDKTLTKELSQLKDKIARLEQRLETGGLDADEAAAQLARFGEEARMLAEKNPRLSQSLDQLPDVSVEGGKKPKETRPERGQGAPGERSTAPASRIPAPRNLRVWTEDFHFPAQRAEQERIMKMARRDPRGAGRAYEDLVKRELGNPPYGDRIDTPDGDAAYRIPDYPAPGEITIEGRWVVFTERKLAQLRTFLGAQNTRSLIITMPRLSPKATPILHQLANEFPNVIILVRETWSKYATSILD